MKKSKQIVHLAQKVASKTRGFFTVKGPGKGNKANSKFMKELKAEATIALRGDYSEKQICGRIKSAVDFYFPEEQTIVEVALSLRYPLSEFHKDLFKAILAKENGEGVNRLLFIAKPGAITRHEEPASKAIIKWLHKYHRISVDIQELNKDGT